MINDSAANLVANVLVASVFACLRFLALFCRPSQENINNDFFSEK